MQEIYRDIVTGGKHVHFIGIGGVSMSSLALISKKAGAVVTGSDSSCGDTVEMLRREGITVFNGQKEGQTDGADAVVYTAAVHPGNPEYDGAVKSGVPLFTRAEYLGSMMKAYRDRIGVAGTHGKTTTTSMLSLIALHSGLDPTVVSGAPDRRLGGAYRLGGTGTFIFEACEYTDSFLSFFPTTALVLNVEREHVDYFKSDEQLIRSFGKYASIADKAIVNAACEMAVRAVKDAGHKNIVWFLPAGQKPCWGKKPCPGQNVSGKLYHAEAVVFDGRYASFELWLNENKLTGVRLSVPGLHNVSDAVAAAAAALENGASIEGVKAGLEEFIGAERRFEPKGKTASGAEVYDDYGHHPTEIAATLDAASRCGKNVWCVFQPHTYTRTVGLFDDFKKVFSDFCAAGGHIIFADIYSAGRESNTTGISSADLAAAVPGAEYIPSDPSGKGHFEPIAEKLNALCGEDDMILTLGAGSITHLASLLVGGE